MLFIFKKKKIVLDCFTADPLVHKYYPVSKVSNFKPKWYTDIPFECKSTDMGEDDPRILPTLRTCPGVVDLLNKGIVELFGEFMAVLFLFIDNNDEIFLLILELELMIRYCPVDCASNLASTSACTPVGAEAAAATTTVSPIGANAI
jgi:hypothetical protein